MEPVVIEGLDSQDPGVSASAVLASVSSGNAVVEKKLVAMLSSRIDTKLACKVAQALGRLKSREAVSEMKRWLFSTEIDGDDEIACFLIALSDCGYALSANELENLMATKGNSIGVRRLVIAVVLDQHKSHVRLLGRMLTGDDVRDVDVLSALREISGESKSADEREKTSAR